MSKEIRWLHVNYVAHDRLDVVSKAFSIRISQNAGTYIDHVTDAWLLKGNSSTCSWR